VTSYERRKIEIALDETQRFIDKESIRNPALRPVEIQETLDFYVAHAAKLRAMLCIDN
jgi:hypothetical protein